MSTSPSPSIRSPRVIFAVWEVLNRQGRTATCSCCFSCLTSRRRHGKRRSPEAAGSRTGTTRDNMVKRLTYRCLLPRPSPDLGLSLEAAEGRHEPIVTHESWLGSRERQLRIPKISAHPSDQGTKFSRCFPPSKFAGIQHSEIIIIRNHSFVLHQRWRDRYGRIDGTHVRIIDAIRGSAGHCPPILQLNRGHFCVRPLNEYDAASATGMRPVAVNEMRYTHARIFGVQTCVDPKIPSTYRVRLRRQPADRSLELNLVELPCKSC